eukprot:scaffold77503_cov19-Tisochrysis_lutea.AAC.3
MVGLAFKHKLLVGEHQACSTAQRHAVLSKYSASSQCSSAEISAQLCTRLFLCSADQCTALQAHAVPTGTHLHCLIWHLRVHRWEGSWGG